MTGAAGYSLDAIKVFGGVNGPLLLRRGGDRAVLLIIIYRSPIFWIDPVLQPCSWPRARRAAPATCSPRPGVTINGQTGGILPVLVFGAGTDYALLLVSRYREELRRHEDKHEAMRDRAAERRARRSSPPALTVIAALLTLSLAEVNSTAGLGPVGAMGIALAMISMLTVLPALLAICGRARSGRPAWTRSRTPAQAGVDETHGFWRRVGDRVARAAARGLDHRHDRAARARGQRRSRSTRARRAATSSAARSTP